MNQIVFVATREVTYSRVAIVGKQLQQHFEVDQIVSRLGSYPIRFLVIAFRLVLAAISGRLAKADAVFVGFFAQPIFPLVRLLYRGPIVADAYFSLYDTFVLDKRKVRPTSLIAKICYRLDQYMLLHADLCITDTDQHVQYFKNQFAAPNANVERLWIGADTKPKSLAVPQWQPGDKFEIFFWGGFIPLQGVETILLAADLLNSDRFKFTIYGTGQTFAQCEQLVQQRSISNVHFGGWQTPENIAETASRSHLALGIFGTTEKAGRVIPNKVYEAMAMGIPMITRASQAIDELLEDGVHCQTVAAGSPERLAEKIVWAQENHAAAIEMAQRGRTLFDQTCSPDAIGRILQRQVLSVLNHQDLTRGSSHSFLNPGRSHEARS